MAHSDEFIHRAIEYLIHEWARAIDEDRPDDLAGLLTPDAEYTIVSRFAADATPPPPLLHCPSAAALAEHVAAARGAERFCHRHLISGIQIVGMQDGAFLSRASYAVARITPADGRMAMLSTGQYRDVIVLDADAPRFRRREVLFDACGAAAPGLLL